MVQISTERIWTFQNGYLGPRRGRIHLDSTEGYVNKSDLFGPVHVIAGLRKSDVAIQFRVRGLPEEPGIHSVGYLVSQVNSLSGEGILVAGDMVQKSPAEWVNTRIGQMWGALHREGYFLSDFDAAGTPEPLSLDAIDIFIANETKYQSGVAL